jgi:serine/threonine-protein kinase RsbW
MTDFRSIGQWTLTGHLPSARQARAHVRDSLAGHPLLDDIELVTSELVANAVKHGGGEIDLGLAAGPGRVRLTVTSDAGPGEPQVRPPTSEGEGGRGLAIVAALADQWGWDRDDDRLSVWAEFLRE